MGRFTCRSLIAAPPSVVFGVSVSVDVHAASMRLFGERAIAGRTSGGLRGVGDWVRWRAWHLGIWWTMTSEITHYERPHRFTDAQRSGPFASFRHHHEFRPHPSGTEMIDEVSLKAPFGVLGWMLEPLLDRYLQWLIERRNRHIREIVEAVDADEEVSP